MTKPGDLCRQFASIGSVIDGVCEERTPGLRQTGASQKTTQPVIGSLSSDLVVPGSSSTSACPAWPFTSQPMQSLCHVAIRIGVTEKAVEIRASFRQSLG